VIRGWPSGSAERELDTPGYFYDKRQRQLEYETAEVLSLLPTSKLTQVSPMKGRDGFDLPGSLTSSSVMEHENSPHSVFRSLEETVDGDLDRLLDEFPGWETDHSHSTVVSPPREQLQREARSQTPEPAEQKERQIVCVDLRGTATAGIQREEKRAEGPAALGASRGDASARGARQ